MVVNIGVSTAKKEVLDAAKRLVDLGLVARTWGNISCRIDDERFAITPSGIGYERLNESNIVVVDIETLEYQGNIVPSSEKGIHATCYKLDEGCRFVIHTHQNYASCISVSGWNLLKLDNLQREFFGGDIVKADYGLPGTENLRVHTEAALKSGSSVVLLEKHGVVIRGENKGQAFERAKALETICERIIKAPLFNDTPQVSSSRSAATSVATSDLHKQIYKACPEFNNIMQLQSEAVFQVMAKANRLEPYLDDFAQMVGNDVKVCQTKDNTKDVLKSIKNRNCIMIKDLGALCCAGTESDCRALISLVEKNALAYLNAAQNNDASSIPWADRKLMRSNYLKKYSNMK